MPHVLFDIDGTLVRLDGVGRYALVAAVGSLTPHAPQAVSAFIHGMDFRGRTDAMLLNEIADHFGLVVADVRRRLYARYLAALTAQVASRTVQPLPGVVSLLALLKKRSVGVGLLTGNVRAAARVKLRPAGLEYLVQELGGFANHGHARVDIAQYVISKLAQKEVSAKDVVVIGDTQHDITAAHAVGAQAVAVATGWTSVEDLRVANPDALVEDLRDVAPIVALLQMAPKRRLGVGL